MTDFLPGHSPQVVVIERGDYAVSYECFKGLTFAHTIVRRWSASVLKSMRHDMDALMELRGGAAVYCYRDAPPRSWSKFTAAMGFKRFAEVDGRSIWVREG